MAGDGEGTKFTHPLKNLHVSFPPSACPLRSSHEPCLLPRHRNGEPPRTLGGETTMAEQTENLLDWLRDAHAMEEQAEHMLRAQIGRIEHYPVVKARIEQHLQETLGQQALLRERIEALGGSTSAMKDLM